MVLSGMGIAPQVVNFRAVCFNPGGVSVAQFALPQRPALVVCISGEHGCPGAAAADGALCRVSAHEQLNLDGHGDPKRKEEPSRVRGVLIFP